MKTKREPTDAELFHVEQTTVTSLIQTWQYAMQYLYDDGGAVPGWVYSQLGFAEVYDGPAPSVAPASLSGVRTGSGGSDMSDEGVLSSGEEAPTGG